MLVCQATLLSFLAGWILLKSNQRSIEHVIEKKAEARIEDKVKNNGSLDPEVLLVDEKSIIKVLQRHEGAMTQRDLVRESGLSKVKVSRVLKKLEAKKIISKYEFGMTNRIRLEKKLKE